MKFFNKLIKGLICGTRKIQGLIQKFWKLDIERQMGCLQNRNKQKDLGLLGQILNFKEKFKDLSGLNFLRKKCYVISAKKNLIRCGK